MPITRNTPLLQGTKPIDFIKLNLSHHCLRECGCCGLYRRNTPNNARDKVDQTAVALSHKNTIQLIDVASGRLMQTATTAINLVNAGHRVELCIMDTHYANWKENLKNAEEIIKTNDSRTLSQLTEQERESYSLNSINSNMDAALAIRDFLKLVDIINKKAGSEVITVNGIFSHIDSYIATVVGKEPLRYEFVPLEKVRSKVKQGKKRRYLSVVDIPGHRACNGVFANEFLQAEKCRDKKPDLVLMIDGIDTFSTVWGSHSMNQKINQYAYENDVVEPISKINPDVIFIETTKIVEENIMFLTTRHKGTVKVYSYDDICWNEVNSCVQALPIQHLSTSVRNPDDKKLLAEVAVHLKAIRRDLTELSIKLPENDVLATRIMHIQNDFNIYTKSDLIHLLSIMEIFKLLEQKLESSKGATIFRFKKEQPADKMINKILLQQDVTFELQAKLQSLQRRLNDPEIHKANQMHLNAKTEREAAANRSTLGKLPHS